MSDCIPHVEEDKHLTTFTVDPSRRCIHLRNMCDDIKTEEASAGIQFMPPLYTQRYVLAVKTLDEYKVKSVVDFGCSECGFVKIIPNACCLERASLVDIDRELLVTKKRQICPEVHHFLQRRQNPLSIALFYGSAEDMDARIQGYEAATLIEVIEHLYPDTLAKVTENVFGRLHPRLVFVTTPNSEFNVLFKNPDPTQFRHWDHKFEWTRSEFQSWCTDVCSRFRYEVKYTGVGEITSDPESAALGPCSQAAVFTLNSANQQDEQTTPGAQSHKGDSGCQSIFGMPYELIAESDFPYMKEKLSVEEQLDQEVMFCLKGIVHSQQSEVPFGEQHRISVEHVARFKNICALADTEGVRQSVERLSFNLTPSKGHILVDEEDSSSDCGASDEEDGYSQDFNSWDEHDRDNNTTSGSHLPVFKACHCVKPGDSDCTSDTTEGPRGCYSCDVRPNDKRLTIEENWDDEVS